MKRRWIRLVVSAGIVAGLVWWTNAAQVLEHLFTLNLGWIGISILAVTFATLLMALRWQLVARALHVRFDYPFALREYYLAQLINSAVPGGVTGDITRAVRTRKQSDMKRAAKSVIAERMLGQIAMVSLLMFGCLVALLWDRDFDRPALFWTVVLILGLIMAATYAVSRSKSSVGKFLDFALQLQLRPSFLALGIGTTAGLILGFYAAARATGIIIPVQALAMIVPLILCAMLIPVSIGGLGWREGAAAALFPIFGAPTSAGVAAGLAYGAVMLISTLPAVLILVRQKQSATRSSTGKSYSP
ncbi:MAG: lysylphosphatidylglycerol synthase transmembrane domain-containing protein [Pseudomonadota bacterium]